jgi:carbon storage regulator
MLVLTRKRDEGFMIGDEVQVTVLAYGGGQVKLGIAAPPHVRVHRTEVWLRIRQEGLQGSPAADRAGRGHDVASRRGRSSTGRPRSWARP